MMIGIDTISTTLPLHTLHKQPSTPKHLFILHNQVSLISIPIGRGVFASQDIPARSVLEVCPVLVLDPSENENHIKKTELYHYT